MNERAKALDHKCPSCGAKLDFNPDLGKWKCEHCGSEFDLETLKKYNNASNEENNTQTSSESSEYVEYHCKNCGAKIVADDQTAATFCVYCGNTAILKNKLSGKFAPSKIIPFCKSKETALEAFRSLNKGRPLMPKFFNKKENIEKITGVYIPFWLFSATSNGKLDSVSEKVTTWTTGNQTHTKTDIFNVKRDMNMKYDRIPVDGSTRFADDIMNTIEPFDYSKMVDYNHAYLSGFLAERYDVEDSEASKIAKSRADKSTKNALMNSLSAYTVNNTKNEVITTNITNTEYVLLPVWMVNVKYMGKFYTFAMNAQTGEFVGNIPVDRKKAIMYGIMYFLAAALIVFIISYVIHML